MSKLNIYDKHNVLQFKTGKEAPYICSMCGQYVGLSNSISSMGYNLVCMRCVDKMEHLTDSFDIKSLIWKAGHQKQVENGAESEDINI